MESDYGILPYFTKAIGRNEQQWAPGLGACPPRATEQNLLASKGLILTKNFSVWRCYFNMGMSGNGVQTPNEIAIFHRDNDQQNHWV